MRELAGAVCAIVATRYRQDRALAPDVLAAACRAAAPGLPVEAAADLVTAVAIARTRAAGSRPVLIAGSLFVIGEARVAFLGAPADPIAVSDPPATSS